MKKTDEQHIFAVKTLRLIDEDEAQKIRQLKSDVLRKRREKRQKGCSEAANDQRIKDDRMKEY